MGIILNASFSKKIRSFKIQDALPIRGSSTMTYFRREVYVYNWRALFDQTLFVIISSTVNAVT